MDSELMLDVGQANEFKLAARKAGYTNADIKRMCEGDTLFRLLPVVRGTGEVQIRKHLIDLDAKPFCPKGWEVVEHSKGGQFEWNPAKVRLHLDEGQKEGRAIEGNELRKQLKSQSVFNANLLDYLITNPQLIPDEWKGKSIFFWGTIYRDPSGILGVRYLSWNGGRWVWFYYWLDLDWRCGDPAAVYAS